MNPKDIAEVICLSERIFASTLSNAQKLVVLGDLKKGLPDTRMFDLGRDSRTVAYQHLSNLISNLGEADNVNKQGLGEASSGSGDSDTTAKAAASRSTEGTPAVRKVRTAKPAA